MKLSAILAPLMAAKVPHEVIMETVLAYEAEQSTALDRRREADAARQARKREREKSRDITLRHSDRSLTGERVTRVEDITSNLEIEPQEKKDTGRSRDLSEFKAELADLDADRLEAVVKLRRSKKGQITGLAARLFKADAQACGLTLAQAVDTCVSRNWITVKPEYGVKPPARGSPGSSKPGSVQALVHSLATEMQAADDRHNPPDGRHRPFVVALPGSRFGTG